jgi:L-alanine-DL-glutamate epimerase-like enolase superfamily enzyme
MRSEISAQPEGAGEVTRVEVIPYALPFREPYLTARGRIERREMVLIRVHTSDGLVGLGDAVPLSLRGGASLREIEAGLRELSEKYASAGGGSNERTEVLRRALPTLPAPARSAVATAWVDLAGKWQGIPAWQVLGAQAPQPIACNATLGAGEPEAVVTQALEWANQGFSSFKLKLGTGNDLEQVRAVRAALGEAARIRIDVNGVWSVSQALEMLGTLEPLGIELAEQPVGTLQEMARVRPETSIPLAADESVSSVDEAKRAVAMGACDMATVKLAKVRNAPLVIPLIGTILAVYLSSALDGPVGIAAAAHVAQVLFTHLDTHDWEDERPLDPRVAHGLATQRLFADTIASVECELRGDQLHLPPGPGLGVEIDDAALERHRL